MSQTVATARVSWGDRIPDWVLVLAEECDRLKSQRLAGQQLGYSATVINLVLKNAYVGDLAKVEGVVRGRFMGAIVACPVLGEISKDVCFKHQAQRLDAVGTNPERVKLYRACRAGCDNARLPKGDSR